MQIQTEHLQNLKVINFYVKGLLTNQVLLLKKDNPHNPEFIRNIFTYEDGEYCLLTSDLFAYKYFGGTNIENLRLLIMAELEDCFETKQNFSSLTGEKNILELAQAIANSYIRPTLNRDNGDIDILSFFDGVLELKFCGHCADCPFAQNTLNNVIAKTFNRFIPEIKEIRLIT